MGMGGIGMMWDGCEVDWAAGDGSGRNGRAWDESRIGIMGGVVEEKSVYSGGGDMASLVDDGRDGDLERVMRDVKEKEDGIRRR